MELFTLVALMSAVLVAHADTVHYTLHSGNHEEIEHVSYRFKRMTSDNSTPITTNTTIDHNYYTSTFLTSESNLFLDVTQMDNTTHHEALSTNYLHALRQTLKFRFPFYGHFLTNLYVTTNGFLFLSPSWHRFLTETHYVAPLMANFNPNISSDSKVYLYSTESMFITQWDKLVLTDEQHHGPFTFQVQLYPNGSVVFAYKDIPIPLANISSANHPVRVGMSNAFIRSFNINGRIYRNIVRYHTIALPVDNIHSNTAFKITELPSCISATSCIACSSGMTLFQCRWCEKLKFCSDGLDWFNQQWMENSCHTTATNTCSIVDTTTSPPPTMTSLTPTILITFGPPLNSTPVAQQQKNDDDGLSGAAKGGIVFMVIVIIVLLVIIGLLYWAYLHPTTTPGMMLIKYNPKKWFKKDESVA